MDKIILILNNQVFEFYIVPAEVIDNTQQNQVAETPPITITPIAPIGPKVEPLGVQKAEGVLTEGRREIPDIPEGNKPTVRPVQGFVDPMDQEIRKLEKKTGESLLIGEGLVEDYVGDNT